MKQTATLLFILLLLLIGFTPKAQNIRGYIFNGTDSSSLSGTTINAVAARQNTVSDVGGYFSLPVKAALPVMLKISRSGYETISLFISDTITTLKIYLQPAYNALEEVVVTGVSGSAKIKSVPVAISVVSAKDLALHSNTNAIDALSRSVPGLQTVTTGPNVSKPSIRGLGYNRVLTLFDGIRQEGQQWADEHGIEADQYNINRAEVVKGPASLAYGSDAVAGVINILPFVPAQPTNGIKGNVLTEYFSNNEMAAASTGFYQFKNDFFWAGRISFKTAKDYRNAIDGRVFNTGFRETNLSTLAGIRKKWGQSYLAFTLYNNLQEIPDGSRDSLTRKFTYQIAEGTQDDLTNRPVVPANRLNSYTIDPLHQHIRHYRLYNKTEVRLGGGLLQSAISFTQNIRQEYNHPTQPRQAGLYIVLNTFQYTANWNKTFENDWQLTTGINTMFQTNRSKNGTDFPIPDYNMTDAGAFAMLKKEWRQWNFSGGLRYDNRTLRWKDFYTATNPVTGFDYPIKNNNDTTGANLAFSSYNKSFSGITASFGVTYSINNHWFIKANVARGYRSPNITEAGANGLDPGAHIYYIGNRSFSPEFNWQQDVGLFFTGSGLEMGIEVFNNRIKNYIFLEKMLNAAGQPVELVPGNATYTYRQGAARLYGLDASIKYTPPFAKWLRLNSTLSSVTGINQDETQLKLYGTAARYLPLISPLPVLTAVRFSLPAVSGSIKNPFLRLEADLFAAQRKFYGVQNTETATPAYQLFNAAIGFDVGKKSGATSVSVSLQAENIFNLGYQSHLNRLKYFETYTAAPNGRSGIYNMGRNISARVVLSF